MDSTIIKQNLHESFCEPALVALAWPPLWMQKGCAWLLEFRVQSTDCNLRQGARHLKGTYKDNFLTRFF